MVMSKVPNTAMTFIQHMPIHFPRGALASAKPTWRGHLPAASFLLFPLLPSRLQKEKKRKNNPPSPTASPLLDRERGEERERRCEIHQAGAGEERRRGGSAAPPDHDQIHGSSSGTWDRVRACGRAGAKKQGSWGDSPFPFPGLLGLLLFLPLLWGVCSSAKKIFVLFLFWIHVRPPSGVWRILTKISRLGLEYPLVWWSNPYPMWSLEVDGWGFARDLGSWVESWGF